MRPEYRIFLAINRRFTMTERPTLTTSAATPLGGRTETPIAIGRISVPDSRLAREIAELVRNTESPLLFHHSSRVFYRGALTAVWRGLTVDAELLYAGAMFPAYACPGITRAPVSGNGSLTAILVDM